MLGKGAHAKGLRCVVSGVDDHKSFVLGIYRRPVRSFAGYKRIDPDPYSLSNSVGIGASGRTDCPLPCSALRRQQAVDRLTAKGTRECADPVEKLNGGDIAFTADTTVDGFIAREPCQRFKSQFSGQQY